MLHANNTSIFFFKKGTSLVAQTVKCLPAMWETWVQSLRQEDPLEEGMATHSSILVWRIPWTEEPGGLQSTGLQRVRQGWGTPLPASFLLLLSVLLLYMYCHVNPHKTHIRRHHYAHFQRSAQGYMLENTQVGIVIRVIINPSFFVISCHPL